MLTTIFQLLVLMVAFSIIEGLWPAARDRKWWRRPILVDICSWLVHPLSVTAGIVLAVSFVDWLLAHSYVADAIANWRSAMTSLPFAVHVFIAVVIADFLWYWLHRAYHHFPLLWAFHIVHHSSEELDWLSTSRLHPLGQMFNHAGITAVLLLLGIPVSAVVASNVLIGAGAVIVHANVRWSFGPLAQILVSPIFHQWHHARCDRNHASGNYGALFSIWDRMFGTCSVPAATPPTSFGTEDSPKSTIVDLFLHPFRLCAIYVASNRCKSSKPSEHSNSARCIADADTPTSSRDMNVKRDRT